MELGLKEKSVFVSASSGGIGLAIAEAFLEEGARVLITGRTTDKLAHAQRSLSDLFGAEKVLQYCGDLTDPKVIDEAINHCADQFGGVDVVVANLGSGKGPTGWDLSQEDWHSINDTNLVGGMLLASKAIPFLKDGKNPSITFISSIAGCEALPAPIPYSAAKAALQMGAKNLSRQLGGEGIRVNTIAPGNVFFPGGTWQKKMDENEEQVKAYISSEVPLGRFAEPREVADAVVFLASDKARFITGALLSVDGGQTH